MDIRTSDLSAQVGISPSYASEILNGKRNPSRSLAIHIFRSVGWRHSSLDGLTDDELALAAKMHPWTRAA